MDTTNGATTTIHLNLVKEAYQSKFLNLIDKYDGDEKAIVWDESLIRPFDLIADNSLLSKHFVKKNYQLSPLNSIGNKVDHVIYLIRKDLTLMPMLAESLLKLDRSMMSKTSLVFVPQKCISCEKYLKQLKVDLDKLNAIDELPIQLFMIDTDILSMENESVFRNIHLDDDYTSVRNIVNSLVDLQEIYGIIPKISAQGKVAKMVTDLLKKKNSLIKNDQPPQIHHLIVIDRKIDLFTMLLTQLTYEGLLDEVFGIEQATISLPAAKFYNDKEQSDPNKPSTVKLKLRSSEELFAQLRDCHINAVGTTLRASAHQLQAEHDELKREGTKTTLELKKTIERLPYIKAAKNSQSNHTTMAELLNEHISRPEFICGLRIEHTIIQQDKIYKVIPEIETKLLRQESAISIIRLMCLQSIANNGLKPKVIDHYKKEIIQNYGNDFLLFLEDLKKASLLLHNDNPYPNSYGDLKSRLDLIKDDVSESNPDHLSYVYGGYAPISITMVKNLVQQPTVWRNETALVFFIGGCTFAEISALRYLSKQEDFNWEFIVATTKILNGKTFLESLWPVR